LHTHQQAELAKSQQVSSRLFHVEQFRANGNGFGEVCCKSLILLRIHLRKIMGFCALLQRMGIFPPSAKGIALLRAKFSGLNTPSLKGALGGFRRASAGLGDD
jgi:hypothetical protein